MLLLALACPDEFEILGITTVAGNVPLDLTQRNARIMCELAGRTDVPVFAGCDKPMRHELITAENVHGKTGIDGVDIYEPAMPLQEQHAVDFIIETLLDGRRQQHHAGADRTVDQHRSSHVTTTGYPAKNQGNRADGRRHARGGQHHA